MCGFTGYLDTSNTSGDEEMRQCVLKMAEQIASRGPDDFGAWVDPEAGLALGHRRLSIIDLSTAGHQPMISQSGRSVIAYNGEVYNFAELRTELEALGKTFRGESDTEVILEACEAWGVQETVERLIGMFAFAFWDRETRKLNLVRDRLGIKPLYWGHNEGVLFFGSQLKSFKAHPSWNSEIDRNALRAYMRHNYIPAPHSIYKGLSKLEPGHIITFNQAGEVTKHCYWDLREIAKKGGGNRFSGSDKEAVDQLEVLLKDAVKRRMVSDVPLGAFLSGGIDSSLVVALMQAQSERPVKSFSIGFHEKGYDEAQHAKAVAAHLGTEHTELYVEPSHAIDVMPNLAQWYDEPFADSSQVPTYLVSEMTKKHVTVALSGDGGDELFAGYNRYLWGDRIWKNVGWMPGPLRSLGGSAIRGLSISTWDKLFSLIPDRIRPPYPGDKMHKLSNVLGLKNSGELYMRLLSQWDTDDDIVLDAQEPKGILWDETVEKDIPDFVERMQFLDTLTYLPDDILAKVDRASMAVGLEARVPLLDHRAVEFAWQLPRHMKIRGGETKWILQELLSRYVPRSLTDRPKMGFGVPIDYWLRNELNDWAEDLLDPARLAHEGFFRPEPIRKIWEEHLSGRRNWQYKIWPVLMFQSWLENERNV